MPWLITTSLWPALTAHLAGTAASLLVDPAVAVGAAMGATVCAGAVVIVSRATPRRRDPFG
jgi:hypothetical protein